MFEYIAGLLIIAGFVSIRQLRVFRGGQDEPSSVSLYVKKGLSGTFKLVILGGCVWATMESVEVYLRLMWIDEDWISKVCRTLICLGGLMYVPSFVYPYESSRNTNHAKSLIHFFDQRKHWWIVGVLFANMVNSSVIDTRIDARIGDGSSPNGKSNNAAANTAVSIAPKQACYAFHPHGVLPFGGVYGLTTNYDVHVLTASACFYIPGFRDLLLHCGMSEVTKNVFLNILKTGASVGVCPGGASESMLIYPDKDVIYLKHRKGFIRVAMQTATPIVPVYTFGETATFHQSHNSIWQAISNQIKQFLGFNLPLIALPQACTLTTVIGKPLHAQPQETVDQFHQRYMEALQALYDDYPELSKGRPLVMV